MRRYTEEEVKQKLAAINVPIYSKYAGRLHSEILTHCLYCENFMYVEVNTLLRIDRNTSKYLGSCGCLSLKEGSNHFLWGGYGEISSDYWRIIRYHCKRGKNRIIPFEITIDYAWNLFLKQNRKCALTGIEIFFVGRSKTDSGKVRQTASLDRIDSKKGYQQGNVQWVHKDINNMKQEFDQKYFIEMCKKVAGNT